MSRKDDEVCDPKRIGFFEIQIIKWQEDCPEQARGSVGEEISEKFTTAQDCSEEKRRLSQKRADCDARLEEAEREVGCIGEACVSCRRKLDKIAKDCGTPALDRAFSKKIGELQRRIKERINEADRLQALTGIIQLCNQYAEISGMKRATAAYNRMLQKVTDDPFIRQTPKKGSEVDWVRKEALSTCDQALLLALEVILPVVSKKLDRTRHRGRKKHAVAKLKGLYKRMVDADGTALFPNAGARLDKVIQQYAPQAKSDVIAEKNLEQTPPKPAAQENEPAARAKSDVITPKHNEEKAPEPIAVATKDITAPKRIVALKSSEEKAPEPVVPAKSGVSVTTPESSEEKAPGPSVPAKSSVSVTTPESSEKKAPGPSVPAKRSVTEAESSEKKNPGPSVPAKSSVSVTTPESSEEKAPGPSVQSKSDVTAPESNEKKTPEPDGHIPLLLDVTGGARADAASHQKQHAVSKEGTAAPRIRTAAQDRKFLIKSETRCRELRKDSAYFYAKAVRYKKENSTNKMVLYQGNLDATNKELEALIAEIAKVAKSTILPPDERERLLNNLKKVGCLREK